MNILTANEARQANRLIQFFVLLFPERMIPTDGEKTMSLACANQQPAISITGSIFFFFLEELCAPQ